MMRLILISSISFILLVHTQLKYENEVKANNKLKAEINRLEVEKMSISQAKVPILYDLNKELKRDTCIDFEYSVYINELFN